MNLYQAQVQLPFEEMAQLLKLPMNCLGRQLVMIVCNPNGEAKGFYGVAVNDTNSLE